MALCVTRQLSWRWQRARAVGSFLTLSSDSEADVITAFSSIQSRTRGGSDRSASSETPLVLFEQPALVSKLALQAHISQSKAAVPFTPREKAPRRSEVAHQ